MFIRSFLFEYVHSVNKLWSFALSVIALVVKLVIIVPSIDRIVVQYLYIYKDIDNSFKNIIM